MAPMAAPLPPPAKAPIAAPAPALPPMMAADVFFGRVVVTLRGRDRVTTRSGVLDRTAARAGGAMDGFSATGSGCDWDGATTCVAAAGATVGAGLDCLTTAAKPMTPASAAPAMISLLFILDLIREYAQGWPKLTKKESQPGIHRTFGKFRPRAWRKNLQFRCPAQSPRPSSCSSAVAR
jgi:hypothetical protein